MEDIEQKKETFRKSGNAFLLLTGFIGLAGASIALTGAVNNDFLSAIEVVKNNLGSPFVASALATGYMYFREGDKLEQAEVTSEMLEQLDNEQSSIVKENSPNDLSQMLNHNSNQSQEQVGIQRRTV